MGGLPPPKPSPRAGYVHISRPCSCAAQSQNEMCRDTAAQRLSRWGELAASAGRVTLVIADSLFCQVNCLFTGGDFTRCLGLGDFAQ